MDLIETSENPPGPHPQPPPQPCIIPQNPINQNDAQIDVSSVTSPPPAPPPTTIPPHQHENPTSTSESVSSESTASSSSTAKKLKTSHAPPVKVTNKLVADAYDSDGDDEDEDFSNSRLEELTSSWLTPAPAPPKPAEEPSKAEDGIGNKEQESSATNNGHGPSSGSSTAETVDSSNSKSVAVGNDISRHHEELKRTLSHNKEARHKRDMEQEERERMQVLVSNFTVEQLDRYEMYRRSAFPKAAIKRIMHLLTGTSVSQNAVIAMSGIAKVFIGEIVEESLDVMERNNETGPVQPKHIREAVRKMRLRGAIPNSKARKFNPYPF